MGTYYRQIEKNHSFTFQFLSKTIKEAIEKKAVRCLKIKIGGTPYEVICDGKSLRVVLVWDESGKEVNQVIRLIEQPSNLRNGSKVYYFECPYTGVKTRTMYKLGGYFASRKSAPKLYYYCQSLSKKWREIKFREDPERVYGKPIYRGKETPYGKRCRKHLLRDIKICKILEGRFLI